MRSTNSTRFIPNPRGKKDKEKEKRGKRKKERERKQRKPKKRGNKKKKEKQKAKPNRQAKRRETSADQKAEDTEDHTVRQGQSNVRLAFLSIPFHFLPHLLVLASRYLANRARPPAAPGRSERCAAAFSSFFFLLRGKPGGTERRRGDRSKSQHQHHIWMDGWMDGKETQCPCTGQPFLQMAGSRARQQQHHLFGWMVVQTRDNNCKPRR